MRLMIAALAALWMITPASASPNTDDRYFDSRAPAVQKHVKVRKAVHRKMRVAKHRYVRKVVSRRLILPHDRITLTTADEQPKTRRETIHYAPQEDAAASRIIGGRPHGCPRAYCGCGASLHLFGRIIPFLNLAANWLSFPRVAPAPKMAAARRGHVFVLERHIEGKKWLAYDANSGGRMIRLHVRSIVGYTIVNPHGGPT